MHGVINFLLLSCIIILICLISAIFYFKLKPKTYLSSEKNYTPYLFIPSFQVDKNPNQPKSKEKISTVSFNDSISSFEVGNSSTKSKKKITETPTATYFVEEPQNSKHLSTQQTTRVSYIYFSQMRDQFSECIQKYYEIGFLQFLYLSKRYTSYIDINGRKFDNKTLGSSVGLGLRTFLNRSIILGTNIYYDFQENIQSSSFHRTSVGFELLSNRWNAYANIYVPVGRHIAFSKLNTFLYTDGYIASCQEENILYPFAADLEIGTNLFTKNNFTLYGGIGPIYCMQSKNLQNTGGKIRLKLNYTTSISFSFQASYSSKDRWRYQTQVELIIPLEIFSDSNYSSPHTLRFKLPYRSHPIKKETCQHWEWNW